MKQEHHTCTTGTPSHIHTSMHTPNVQIALRGNLKLKATNPQLLHDWTAHVSFCCCCISSGHCNRQPSHHQDTGRFSFHPNISTHLRQQTLQTFVFPLSAPQGRDGPVPCDHIPQPASRREQQLDSVMLPCNPVHPSLSLPKE